MEMSVLGDGNESLHINHFLTGERLVENDKRSRLRNLLWREQVSDLETFVIDNSNGSDHTKTFQQRLGKLLQRQAWFLIERHLWTGYEIPSAPKMPISEYFHRFSDKALDSRLGNAEDQICLVVTSVYDIRGIIHHLQASMDGDLMGAANLLPEVTIWALYKEWELSSEQFSLLQNILSTPAHDFHSVELQLPSQYARLKRECNFARRVVYDGRTQSLTFFLNWPSSCPSDFSSFNVHVWKAHYNFPKIDYGKIILFDLCSSTMKLFVSLSSATCLQEIRSEYFKTRLSTGFIKYPNDCRLLLLAIFSHIRNRSAKFAIDCALILQTLKFEARRQPSASKIDFLSHLIDTLELSKSAINQVMSQIHQLHTIFEYRTVKPRTRSLYLLIKSLKKSSRDLKHITRRIEESRDRAQVMKTEITESIGVAQSWRTNVVTLIVAFYVPLSFASSIFGMNLEAPPSFQDFFFTSNSSLVQAIQNENMTMNIRKYEKYFNQTQDPLREDAQAKFPVNFMMTGATLLSSTRTWSTKEFLYVALPLMTGTIILPLIGGTAFGVAARFIIKYTLWARNVLIGFLIVYLYLVYALLPVAMIPFIILGPLFFTVLLSFMLFKDWQGLTPEGRLLRVLLFILITSAHIVLLMFWPIFSRFGVPSIYILPWVGLGLWFMYPKFRAWRKRRTGKRNA